MRFIWCSCFLAWNFWLPGSGLTLWAWCFRWQSGLANSWGGSQCELHISGFWEGSLDIVIFLQRWNSAPSIGIRFDRLGCFLVVKMIGTQGKWMKIIPLFMNEWWMDGWMDVRKQKRKTDGQEEWKKERRMDRQMDGWMDGNVKKEWMNDGWVASVDIGKK